MAEEKLSYKHNQITVLSEKKPFIYLSTAAGIPLNKKNFWMLYGNHIRSLIRRRTGLSRFQEITHGLWAKGYYTDTQRCKEFYTETIYT